MDIVYPIDMGQPIFEYDSKKDLKLLKERGIGFEDVIAILNDKGALAVLDHPNTQKHPNQKIYVLDISGYAYLVPFEKQDHKAILKMIFPSRKMTRIYQKALRGSSS